LCGTCLALLIPLAGFAQGSSQAAQQRVAALKQAMATSQQNLRKYEWMETTVVKHDGDEKSRTQNRVYYGADGKQQKVAVTAPPPPADKKRGVRGRVGENVKENIGDYMKSAVELVHKYVPPQPDAIQKAVEGQRMTFTEIEPGKKGRIELRNYLLAGDVYTMEIDLTNNHMLGLAVKSYIDKPKDAVSLQVKFADLPDGTTHAAQTTLDAAEKKINVAVSNEGYRQTAK